MELRDFLAPRETFIYLRVDRLLRLNLWNGINLELGINGEGWNVIFENVSSSSLYRGTEAIGTLSLSLSTVVIPATVFSSLGFQAIVYTLNAEN